MIVSPVRLRLAALALVVVCGQLGNAVSMIVAAVATTGHHSMAAGQTVCTCAHGPMSECPMHKSSGHGGGQPSSRGSSQEDRWCRGCDDPTAVVLTTMTLAGVVVERQLTSRPPNDSRLIDVSAGEPLDLALPVVSPPPRL